MITFYFSGKPFLKHDRFQRAFDTLRSWNGTPEDIKAHFDMTCNREQIHVQAIFDNSTQPPTLTTPAGNYAFADLRSFREDFPQFFVGLDGNIYESDAFVAGKIGLVKPVLQGPP